jgi:hypothetical protein
VKVDSSISEEAENRDLDDVAKKETENSHVMLLM